ncbi:MAG: FAD-binding protein [Chryseobacterium sp.]|nr:MAG: FAD-binding protein [Chryseobacterium sp.]
MREKIVIIGGGFAGLQLARNLNNQGKYKVMVIDKMNHHMFQPLFYQVATGRIEPSNISFPFRKIFQRSKNIQFRMTEVKKIIPSENKVIGDDGVFTYDKLVIATGCKTNFFGNQKMQDLMAVSNRPQVRNPFVPKRRSSYLLAARLLGGMMGERLYGAYRKKLLSKQTLTSFLRKSLKEENFNIAYYEMMEIIESLPAPFRSKREKM